MAGYINGDIREQINMIPTCLDEMITEDNPVRAIDAIIDILNMKELGFKYADINPIGRDSYNPSDMLKLFLYCYYNTIRASRKIEAECHRNIEIKWLINNLTPDHKTIANFRKDNKVAIKAAFRQFVVLCDELGLIGKTVLAMDGSKFRASNARKKNYTKNKVKKMIEYFEKAIEDYIELLNENDAQDVCNAEANIISTTNIKEKIQHTKNRIEELKQLAKRIEEEGEISITDPDSKHMSVSNNGTDVSYNVQTVVDSKHHIVVAVEVINTPADQGQLHPMAHLAATELGLLIEDRKESTQSGEPIITVLADKGYHTGEDLKKCKEDNIEVIVAKPNSPSSTGDPRYTLDKFIYDKENDSYICPQNKVLKNVSKPETKKPEYKNNKACKECHEKNNCTKSKNGRSIRRSEYQEIIDEATKRMQENKELYKQRQMIAEHPFGTIKRGLGFTYFLMRRLENVRTESFMHFFVYNVKRVINIIGVKGLLEKAATLIHLFKYTFCTKKFYSKYFRDFFKKQVMKFIVLTIGDRNNLVFTQPDVANARTLGETTQKHFIVRCFNEA